ncbi:MAG: hypothetical protein KKB31_06125 [Nanoarchaeota archaeon]|nr:hypothetical protein [Nanoarchaeota archaeon]
MTKKANYDKIAKDSLKKLEESGRELNEMQEELAGLKKTLVDAKKSLKGYKQRMNSTYQRLQEAQAETYSTREEVGRKLGGIDEENSRLRNMVREYKGPFAFLFIILGIFFLQLNITGNAISNLSTNTTFGVGGILLILGLIAGFSFFNPKKKLK